MRTGVHGKTAVKPIRSSGRQAAVTATFMDSYRYPQRFALCPKWLIGRVTQQPPLNWVRAQKYSFPAKLRNPPQFWHHLFGRMQINSSHSSENLRVIAAK